MAGGGGESDSADNPALADYFTDDEDPDYVHVFFGEEMVRLRRADYFDSLAPVPSTSTAKQPVNGSGEPGPSQASANTSAEEFEPMDMEDREEDSELKYTVVNTDDLIGLMKSIIEEVNVIANLPVTVVRMLLTHFRWDKECLLERLFVSNEDDAREQLFKEARVHYPTALREAQSPTSKKLCVKFEADTLREDCLICYVDFPAKELISASCAHGFCDTCWRQYLTTKISDEGILDCITCPAHECPVLVDDEMVLELVTDARIRQKYQRMIANNFVEFNKMLRWCPGSECTNVVKVRDILRAAYKSVKCQCGQVISSRQWSRDLEL